MENQSFNFLQKRCITLRDEGKHNQACSGAGISKQTLINIILQSETFPIDLDNVNNEEKNVKDVNNEERSVIDIDNIRRIKYMRYSELLYYGSPKAVLGKGASGSVFLYSGGSYGKKVAIKIKSHKKDINNGEWEYDILVEATLLVNLNHKYILQAIDITTNIYKQICLVLPLSLGTLRDRLANINKNDSLIFAYQISCAVNYLHSIGIIHGDIKPDNILIFEENGSLISRMSDFGSAIINNCVSLEDVVGIYYTIWYRPPEVLLELPFNESADIWALGATLYELFTNTVFAREFYEDRMLVTIYKNLGYPKNIYKLLDRYTGEYLALYDSIDWIKNQSNKPYIGLQFLKGSKPSDDIVILLSSLLQYNPNKRPTANYIIKNNIFDKVRNINDENIPRLSCRDLLTLSSPYPSNWINNQWVITPKILIQSMEFLSKKLIEYSIAPRCVDFALRLIDTYLSIKNISEDRMLLLVCVCLVLSSSWIDQHILNTELVAIMSDSSISDVVYMEKDVLKTLNFNIIVDIPLDYAFLWKKSHVNIDFPLLSMITTIVSLSKMRFVYNPEEMFYIALEIYQSYDNDMILENTEDIELVYEINAHQKYNNYINQYYENIYNVSLPLMKDIISSIIPPEDSQYTL